MAKCNICNRRWWFSSQVKCDCKSRQLKQRIKVEQEVWQNVHLQNLYTQHLHTSHSTHEKTTSPCDAITQPFSQPRQESSYCDSSSSYDSGSSSSSSPD